MQVTYEDDHQSVIKPSGWLSTGNEFTLGLPNCLPRLASPQGITRTYNHFSLLSCRTIDTIY